MSKACLRSPVKSTRRRRKRFFHYDRHRPEHTTLYRLVQQHAATFVAQVQASTGADLPRFVQDEFDAFLDCGILARGFLRLRCDGCGHDRLLAFSCKRRGFCPSCGGRRMAQTAAHLVDKVIPQVPVRQWVLSLPIPLRLLLAAQPLLITPALQVVQRAVARLLLQQTGVLVQEHEPAEEEGFAAGHLIEDAADNDEARTLRPLQAAAVTYRIAFGPRAEQKVLTLKEAGPREAGRIALCAEHAGFSLHAAVRCGADERQALERLCRTITRPALANDRVQTNAAGQVVLRLKTPWRDGTTHVVMSPL